MVKNSRERDEHSIQYRWMPPEVSCSGSIQVSPAGTTRADGRSNGNCNGKIGGRPSAKIVTTPEFLSASVELWKAISRPLSPSHVEEMARCPGSFQRGLSVSYCFSSAAKSDCEQLKVLKLIDGEVRRSFAAVPEKIGGTPLSKGETTPELHCVVEQATAVQEDLLVDDPRGSDEVEINRDCTVRSSSCSKEEDAQAMDRSAFPPLVPASARTKVEELFSKGKHALAGGLAGAFVSICLHPVDTVKSNVQAHGRSRDSLIRTIKNITSERGVKGLYRGIPSSLASSAPISAVYTFTYESVKGASLPLLPKEYHSFAHCGAGGCASVATSFIFTPSERIKQQMQVHSCYQNSWNALVGIVQKGGLPSLYAGWRAVLWRNVPHSIIKFYTYERLKQSMQPSSYPDARLTPFPTLVCGGLAGSTAALFTTPFDVVKTRLQARMPGSQGKHQGVVPLLVDISRREGIRGLYRGLTPRLLMYVSQGAIFFGSYEFLKAAFSFPREGESRHVSPDSSPGLPRGSRTVNPLT